VHTDATHNGSSNNPFATLQLQPWLEGTVRVFRQKSAIEDAIELHAFAPLEAVVCVCVRPMAMFSGVHSFNWLILYIASNNTEGNCRSDYKPNPDPNLNPNHQLRSNTEGNVLVKADPAGSTTNGVPHGHVGWMFTGGAASAASVTITWL
jgi:hypothetical protein